LLALKVVKSGTQNNQFLLPKISLNKNPGTLCISDQKIYVSVSAEISVHFLTETQNIKVPN